MDKLIIKTNRQWRNFKYANEVPAAVLESDFDYQDRDEILDGFFCYRGVWYHLDQFMRIDGASPLKGWHGYLNDSFYSGVVINLSSDGGQFQVGTFYS